AQVVCVNVVPYLLSLVTENLVRPPRHGTLHEVREKAMQYRPGVTRPRDAPPPEHPRLDPEIPGVLLHEDVGGDLRCAKQAMHRGIDRHRFVDSALERVTGFDLVTGGKLAERQSVRCIAIHLIRG